MKITYLLSAAVGLLAASPAVAQITTTSNSNANQLATALQGTGVTFTSATLTGTSQTGTFNNGTAATGINSGVILTTGLLSCAGPVNTVGDCGNSGGNGTGSALALTFTATNASLFFNYVFASEEYNEFVLGGFNDVFSLRLNGANYSNVNLAVLPNNSVVSIDTVNLTTNSAFYRNNSTSAGPGTTTGPSLNLPIQYDGLTALLTATATNLVVGSQYTLTFDVDDVGDAFYDSAVFIQGGSIGVVAPPVDVDGAPAVPEPASWAMMMIGIGIVGGALRRRRSPALAMA